MNTESLIRDTIAGTWRAGHYDTAIDRLSGARMALLYVEPKSAAIDDLTDLINVALRLYAEDAT
ncbi:hypothetical protein [Endozoicomonas sp. 4G]|uniref:hypothetical protein n=1 Tax=Endozoicomonas sp. 4G TaxID=2872754 RepID=UPI001BCEEF98|nr:hypothetical protein [Endozoicomonas sp. 4G]